MFSLVWVWKELNYPPTGGSTLSESKRPKTHWVHLLLHLAHSQYCVMAMSWPYCHSKRQAERRLMHSCHTALLGSPAGLTDQLDVTSLHTIPRIVVHHVTHMHVSSARGVCISYVIYIVPCAPGSAHFLVWILVFPSNSMCEDLVSCQFFLIHNSIV